MALSCIPKPCRHCGNIFTAVGSNRQVHCSIECRFWSKVDIRGADECWPWLGWKNADGYGYFRIGSKKVKAHRVAFELTNGPLKNHGLHTCDNPPCCNYGHLWDGTHQQNMRDRDTKGRLGERRGTANGNAKLTEEQVLAIRSDSRTSRALADEYGVNRKTIESIWHRKKWQHLH